MKITNVYVERTYNVGNYESLKIGFEATLSETDQPLQVTADLEMLAHQHIENRKAAKQASPQVQANNPAPQLTKAPVTAPKKPDNICPNCGAFKKPQYPLCYQCNLDEKQNAGN